MILTLIATLLLSSPRGDLLVKNNGTSCHFDKNMDMECVTVYTFKTDKGQLYTAMKRCNSSKKDCRMYSIDKRP